LRMTTLDQYMKKEQLKMPQIRNKTIAKDEEFRDLYWKETWVNPRDLLRKALESEDEKIRSYADLILNGYHDDRRKRKNRSPGEFDPDGKWYMLYNLVQIIKSRKGGGSR